MPSVPTSNGSSFTKCSNSVTRCSRGDSGCSPSPISTSRCACCASPAGATSSASCMRAGRRRGGGLQGGKQPGSGDLRRRCQGAGEWGCFLARGGSPAGERAALRCSARLHLAGNVVRVAATPLSKLDLGIRGSLSRLGSPSPELSLHVRIQLHEASCQRANIPDQMERCSVAQQLQATV